MKSRFTVIHTVNLCMICKSLKSTDPGISFCCWYYGSMFIGFYTASSRKKIYSIQGSRSWKIIEIGTNWKSTCNFLLFFYCNYMPVIYRFWDITITWLKISIFRRLYPPQKWKLASKN